MALITKPTALSKIWAASGVIDTPADSKIAQGWVVELPPYQYDNWLNNKQDTFIAHVNQLGIPVWDAVTEYQGGKSYVQGTDGVVYKAILTNTNVVPSNPLNSATWTKAFEDFGSVAALTITVNNLATDYSTLANISNTALARTNLSVYSKSEGDARYALVAGNGSQTFAVANASNDTHAINRAQLNSATAQATEAAFGTAKIATQSDSDVGTDDTRILTPKKATITFCKRTNNLSDLANVATARVNLGLTAAATTNLSDFLLKSDNLAGLTNVATARANLGLGSIATGNATDYLTKTGNLAGLADKPTSRGNLGLGTISTSNLFVSTAAPNAGVGTIGDIYFQY
jgi:hypothetical protein